MILYNKLYSGYKYKVYLSVNENDDVLTNEAVMSVLFNAAYEAACKELGLMDSGTFPPVEYK